MWFELSEHLQTTPQRKQTLGESVLQVFSVVRGSGNQGDMPWYQYSVTGEVSCMWSRSVSCNYSQDQPIKV